MEYVVEITKEEIKGNKEIAQALLVAKSPSFVDTTIEVDENNIRIKSEVLEQYDDYNKIMLLNFEDKLRYLINLSKIYTDLENSKYTYRFDKESIVFTENGIPLLVYRGVVNQVYPYDRISYEEFLNQYKAIAISIIDVKADYDKLAAGALEFYRGNLFCEKIAKEPTLDGVVNVLSDFYNKEKQDKQNRPSYLTLSDFFSFFNWHISSLIYTSFRLNFKPRNLLETPGRFLAVIR